MRFESVKAHAFGPFRNETLELASGMNVIHGPNEAGKSSWHAALYAGLCGVRRGKGASRKDDQEFAARHRPWNGGAWEVGAVVVLDAGRKVELRHDLAGKVASSARDAEFAGRDYSNQIINDGAPDGSVWLGINRHAFLGTACVRQADMVEIRPEMLQENMQRAAATAGADETAAGALALLDSYRRDVVGSKRAPTKPLRQSETRVGQARIAWSEARAAHKSCLQRRADVDRREQDARAAQRKADAVAAALAEEDAVRAERRLSWVTGSGEKNPRKGVQVRRPRADTWSMARKNDDRSGSMGPGPRRDPRDVRIEHLEREKAKLIEDRDHWKRRSEDLQGHSEDLKRRIERLEKELEAARRAGRRQAAPFAKDRRQGTGRRPGRRAGAEYGKQGCRRPPARVDETHAAPAPKTCPDCGGHVTVERVAEQYQEDVPDVRPLVRRFDVEVGRCAQCRRRVQGRHPLQTSDALGAAGVQLGPNVAALTAELHTESGLPLEKTARVLRTRFGLHVTKGGLVRLLHRTADVAAPAYAALCEQVRRSPVVTPDETGWRVDATRHWLWAFATPETTVYSICAGRGFADAAAVLGADFAGVLVRDGWVAYRGFAHAPHQTCLAHLLRRCKDLRTDHPDSPWAAAVQTVLQDALALRTRCNAGGIGEHGLASARGRLEARLGRLIDAPPPLAPAERFARHLAREFEAVFLFLRDPSLDATNWRAEHAIRPAVVTRKVCGGNRTRRGADTQQILASVVRTARQRQLDPRALLTTMLCAPEPVVPEALALPPPA